jgi:hypothetical protein
MTAREAELAERVEQLESRLAIQRQELVMLTEIIERDRKRIEAETAIEASRIRAAAEALNERRLAV